ncbi:MAG: MFS transporter [Candidatus Binatia bacterium]
MRASRQTATAAPAGPAAPAAVDGPYARYVLGVLVVVYVLNFLDRQILSILAERIKADLGLSDAQIGFLYGTAFAVFYALFGIPLGRLADVWVRTRLIAVGLGFWSLMTGLSALARSVGQLTAARIGVGVGEASANPAAYSLLCDYFPASQRASVLAIYSSGIYIGAGLGLGLGGLIVNRWDAAFAGQAAPFGFHGWQVAFLAVGLPGLLLALWVRTLREPVRGQSDGMAEAAPHPHPFRELGRELIAVLPPLTLLNLLRLRAGARRIVLNLAAAVGCVAAAALLIRWLGSPPQWIALGIGAYATISWSQSLALRDRAAFAMIFGTPTLRYAGLGFSLLAFTGYGIGFWAAPFLVRVHGMSEAQVGLTLGGIAAGSGWLGVTLGGLWADRWRRRAPAARLYVGICTALLPLPFVLWMLATQRTWLALLLNLPVALGTSMWIGPGASTVQDLVLPRMRAVASAAYLLVVTFIGLALGPYTVGLLSVALGSLRAAMMMALFANALAAFFLMMAARHLPRDERLHRRRAFDAGTPCARAARNTGLNRGRWPGSSTPRG